VMMKGERDSHIRTDLPNTSEMGVLLKPHLPIMTSLAEGENDFGNMR